MTLVLAALVMSPILESSTLAHQVRRIEYLHSTLSFCDQQHQWSLVCANLTLAAHSSELNITVNDGHYNSRLSTRCEDGRLLVTKHNNVTGTSSGDVFHTCGGPLDPVRIEGALDAL